MDRLEELNGQQTAIDSILARQGSRTKELIVLIGAPGTGVTWTLERVSQEWEQFGGAALHAKGEPFASDRKFFPWLTLALPGAKRLEQFLRSYIRT